MPKEQKKAQKILDHLVIKLLVVLVDIGILMVYLYYKINQMNHYVSVFEKIKILGHG